MKKGLTKIILAIPLVCSICAGSTSAYYNVIDLGTIGGEFSIAYSINNNGQIVGYATKNPSYVGATLFDPTGAGNNIDLGTLGGISVSRANSINDNGQIVGAAYSSSGGERACLFDPTGAGNNIDLGTFDGGGSFANSINDNGQIVGTTYSGSGRYAILFDSTGAGNNIDLGNLGGSGPHISYGNSINDNGQIIGSSDGYATLFDPTGAGNNINLGTLGGNGSEALSINNNGLIVGSAYNSLGYLHAALFDITGVGNNIDLGGGAGCAYSINDNGQIVGRMGGNAALFDPTGQGNNINLNTWNLTPIKSIHIGDNLRTIILYEMLKQKGILVSAIRPPTVPVKKSCLRISLSADHTEQCISDLFVALKQVL